MSHRTAARLAWGLWILFWACVGVGLYVENLNPADEEPLSDKLALLIAFGSFSTVGAVVISRRPNHAIGWVFSAVGLGAVIGSASGAYAEYSVITEPGSLPAGLAAAWLQSWTWYPTLALAIIFLPLLFPNGGLPSPRWRPVLWLAVAAIAILSASYAFSPEFYPAGDAPHGASPVTNPIGIDGAGGLLKAVQDFLEPFLLVLFALSVLSMILRFRRAGGDERQQLKWFTYAVVLFAVQVPIGEIFLPDVWFSNIWFATALLLIPVSAGIAILRYRLYDIDRIINRTLVYGLLTGVLGGGYFGGVILLQLLSRPVTGGSGLAVAATTLLVAALFQPARRRVQDAVDRRFNRRRYDAVKTIEAFSARLRQQVDLDSLTEELLAVVRETMQPAHVSLWLRTPEGAGRGMAASTRTAVSAVEAAG